MTLRNLRLVKGARPVRVPLPAIGAYTKARLAEQQLREADEREKRITEANKVGAVIAGGIAAWLSWLIFGGGK